MITSEQFVKDYESYVKEWVHIRNSKNQTHVDAEDLWEKLLAKIMINNILEMYYDDHVSTASFKTWLNKVLNNLYIDMAIEIKNKEWIPIAVGDSKENFGYYKTVQSDTLGKNRQTYSIMQNGIYGSPGKSESGNINFGLDMVFNLIEKIPKIRDRVLVKLKSFIDGITNITDDEYTFLEEKSQMNSEDLREFIKENQHSHKAGMKDKDIAQLLDMKSGSVNTTYQRIVTKYLVEPYNISRAKND